MKDLCTVLSILLQLLCSMAKTGKRSKNTLELELVLKFDLTLKSFLTSCRKSKMFKNQ